MVGREVQQYVGASGVRLADALAQAGGGAPRRAHAIGIWQGITEVAGGCSRDGRQPYCRHTEPRNLLEMSGHRRKAIVPERGRHGTVQNRAGPPFGALVISLRGRRLRAMPSKAEGE